MRAILKTVILWGRIGSIMGMRLRFLSGWIGLALAVGCSGRDASLPVTFPVTGSVVTEKGKPYTGGSLQFHPDSKEDVTVIGDIAADGTFRLRTLKGSTNTEGAPAGSYEVTVIPPLGPDRKALFSTFTMPTKYKIEPRENRLEIRADPPP
jgi:hypothetical protein